MLGSVYPMREPLAYTGRQNLFTLPATVVDQLRRACSAEAFRPGALRPGVVHGYGLGSTPSGGTN